MIGSFPDNSFKSMMWTYWSLAVLCIFATVPTIILKSPPITKKEEQVLKVEQLAWKDISKWFFLNYGVVFLVGVYLFLYIGGETS